MTPPPRRRPDRAADPHTRVDPGLPARVRRRLAGHDPTTRVEDCLPLNRPLTLRQTLWLAGLGASPVLLGPAAVILIMLTTTGLAARQARVGELLAPTLGPGILICLLAGAGQLVGVVRAARRP